MKLHINIPDDLINTRLDTFVSNLSRTCSRSRAASLIDTDFIFVNEQKKKSGYKLKKGDLVTGSIPELKTDNRILPENIPLDILFEDDHIIVINKQHGMVVHPSQGSLSGTLVNAVLFHEPGIRQVGEDPFRPGIVHRLDKDTSGLIVMAKTTSALQFMQKEFKQRRVKKTYLALISGSPADDRGEINLPIGRHPVKRKLMAVNKKAGKQSITLWKIKKRFKNACLVEVLLKTGRTHQIRVHFYAAEHPLIGDLVYQYRRHRKKKGIAQRQMLHAWKLSFRHPFSGRRMRFDSEIPDDFLQTMQLLESAR